MALILWISAPARVERRAVIEDHQSARKLSNQGIATFTSFAQSEQFLQVPTHSLKLFAALAAIMDRAFASHRNWQSIWNNLDVPPKDNRVA